MTMMMYVRSIEEYGCEQDPIHPTTIIWHKYRIVLLDGKTINTRAPQIVAADGFTYMLYKPVDMVDSILTNLFHLNEDVLKAEENFAKKYGYSKPSLFSQQKTRPGMWIVGIYQVSPDPANFLRRVILVDGSYIDAYINHISNVKWLSNSIGSEITYRMEKLFLQDYWIEGFFVPLPPALMLDSPHVYPSDTIKDLAKATNNSVNPVTPSMLKSASDDNETKYVGPGILRHLAKYFPNINDPSIMVPCPKCRRRTDRISDIIIHLNDVHKEPIVPYIADWLETLDVKLEALPVDEAEKRAKTQEEWEDQEEPPFDPNNVYIMQKQEQLTAKTLEISLKHIAEHIIDVPDSKFINLNPF